jgi:predicted Zn-dependent protease
MMKTMIWVLLFPFLVGCATATKIATSVGVGAGVISHGHKQVIDKTAEKAEKAARPITETEEYYIGRGVAARILTQYKIYNDPQTLWYVNHVGRILTLNSSRPYTYGGYHFAVLDTDEINAFACPGGIIFITRGMLDLVQGEDELAAVLAHEIGHVTQKHGLKAISNARWTEVATTLAMESAKQYSGADLGSLVSLFEGTVDDVFQTLVVRGYGRADEFEADALALDGLQASAYDPAELLNLLKALQSAKSQTSGGILSTHPNLTDRMEKVKVSMHDLERSQPAPERIARFKSVARNW